ncbi:MAG: hypothetical protein ABH821_02195 [archaeon]
MVSLLLIEGLIVILSVLVIMVFLIVLIRIEEQKLFNALRRKNFVEREKNLIQYKFFTRKISEKTYNDMIKDKEKELLNLDTIIRKLQRKKSLGYVDSQHHVNELKHLTPKEKHEVRKILTEEELTKEEIKELEKKYYTKRITQEVFQELIKERNERLIESQIKLKEYDVEERKK